MNPKAYLRAVLNCRTPDEAREFAEMWHDGTIDALMIDDDPMAQGQAPRQYEREDGPRWADDVLRYMGLFDWGAEQEAQHPRGQGGKWVPKHDAAAHGIGGPFLAHELDALECSGVTW